MTFGSLFTGIGGMDLGLDRAGLRCAWQVEIDPFCRRVLAKHWPDVRRHDDVRPFPPPGNADDWRVDVIAGGFPCQPVAGGGLKLVDQDKRWLWPEFSRVVDALRPRYLILENVAALLDRGMDHVLSALAEMGFAAEWGVLSACMFGAPHTRERLFLVAYPDGLDGQAWFRVFPNRTASNESGNLVANSRHWLDPFTGTPGMVDGVSCRMDRIRVLGNAVVPQVAQWLGELVIKANP